MLVEYYWTPTIIHSDDIIPILWKVCGFYGLSDDLQGFRFVYHVSL